MSFFRDKRGGGGIGRVDRFYFGFLIGLAEYSRRRAWWVLLGALVVSGLSLAYTITHFAISTNTGKMLSADLPFERAQTQFNAAFPGLDKTLLLVVRSPSPSLARQAAARLATWLGRHGKGITGIYEPGAGPFFAREGLLYLSPKALWTLSDRLSRAQPFMATLAAHPTLPQFNDLLVKALAADRTQRLPGLDRILAALTDTIQATGQGHFALMPWGTIMTGSVPTATGHTAFLEVKPRYNYSGGAPVQTALASVHEAIRALHLTPDHGVQVRITGEAALDNDQVQTVSQSAGLATTLSFGLVLVFLFLGLRSPGFVLAILLTLFFGLTWTAAFALFATGPLNLISVAFAVLFVGLAVDFGIQFSFRYQEERLSGDHAAALGSTARRVGSSLSLAAAAAAIGFYSFVPTDYAGIVDLGIISGTSMFFALFANLTVLPALLTVFNPRSAAQGPSPLRVLLARLPLHRYPRAVMAAVGVVTVALIPVVWSVRFDFDPMHLQSKHSEAVRTFERLLKEGRISPYPINVLAPNLAAAQARAARLSRQPTVGRVLTLASYIPDHQNEKLAVLAQTALVVPPFVFAPANAPEPTTQALRVSLVQLQGRLVSFARAGRDQRLAGTARALARAIGDYLARFGKSRKALMTLQRRVIGTLPWQLRGLQTALNAQPVTIATLPPDLRTRYVAANGAARIEVFSSLNLNSNENIRRFVQSVQQVEPDAIGTPVLLVEGGNAVVQAFREATLISFVLITVLLLLTLRSVADALTILIPLGLAAMGAVAAMRIAGISFNLANIIVLPLLIGLSVAFSIYLVVRWRAGVRPWFLLDTSTSDAVVFSALTTMSSFGSLAVSSNPGMAVLGETLFIAMASALLSILLVLPALLALRRQPIVNTT
ncbi:MAG: MMPL family transporter [Gammaproteobacteria bacterium]|nr:MMPL family transporter [Gammaproteobacteria bacterium]